MPRLSDTMEEGTILRWLKSEGETVARGEELVEIETDKATMVYESDQEGVVTLIASEGETLPVGAPIARVGDRVDDLEDGSRSGGATAEVKEAAVAAAAPATPAPGAPAAAPVPSGNGAAGASTETRIKASPLARRIASERGLDLAAIAGTGPGGRIVKSDVEGAGAGTPAHRPGCRRRRRGPRIWTRSRRRRARRPRSS